MREMKKLALGLIATSNRARTAPLLRLSLRLSVPLLPLTLV